MSGPAMPTPVSRLPKFGSWSKSLSPTPSGAGRLPNGFYHHPGPAVGNGTGPAPLARRIGTIRTPSEYSTKWRKDGDVTDGGHRNDTAHQDTHPQRSAVHPKTLAKSLPVPKSTGLPVPKNRLPISKSRLTGSKQNLQGLSGSKVRPPQRSTLSECTLSCSLEPGCGSCVPAGGSRSSGDLGSVPPSRLKGDGVRPPSLPVRRQASPASSASPLSIKPGHKQSGEGPAGQGGVKKSLKANGVSYKLSRPSLAKQARTVAAEVSQARDKTSARTPSSTGSSPERTSEATASQGEPSVLGETPEDMSLSSGSSVDHNGASQEYMDDFDDLGNGGAGILILAKNDEDDSGLDPSCGDFCERREAGNGVATATELHFLDNALDWSHGTLAGDKGANHLTRHSRSSPSDYHEQGSSSLDLSPSDSCGSGGIYMWDEEGLEPLGGAVARASVDCGHVGHAGSFNSDVTSSDALTNVDSCDLDDDDLMLDGDFPDDISLHTDGDGTSHMAEWRRRQLCWGTQDVHSDDREAACYDERDEAGLDGDLAPHRTPGVDVEDLADDCGALRSQLELLRRFLLQDDDTDDDTLTTDTLSPEDGEQSQVEALLQEVQQLKEDLRSKEQIISQLTLQLAAASATGRCRCPPDRSERTERHTQTSAVEPVDENVASQKPWRERTAFPPSAFLSPPWQYQRSRPYGGKPKPSIPSQLAGKRVETLVLYFSDTPCHRYLSPPTRKSRTH